MQARYYEQLYLTRLPFKGSNEKKKNPNLAAVPTNLHLQLLTVASVVEKEETAKTGRKDGDDDDVDAVATATATAKTKTTTKPARRHALIRPA